MKKILIIAAVLFAATAHADNVGIRNEDGTTHTGTEGGLGPIAMDRTNKIILASSAGSGDFSAQMSVVPLFVVADAAEALSTTTVIVATSHVARVNDYVEMTAGTAANIGVWRRVSAVATNSITVSAAFPATVAATDAFNIHRPRLNTSIYAEDTAHVSGNLGQLILGVVNTNAAGLAAEGDLTGIAVGLNGAVFVDIKRAQQVSDAGSLLKAEDLAAGTGDSGVSVFSKMQSALSIDAATGDYATPKVDLAGRTIIANAPSGERWSACSASNTGTSEVAIKALVASNRICATSLSCFNTATVASAFEIKSNTTAIYAGGISNSTLAGVAYWETSLPTPVCTAVGEALNFDMATTATATTCCGAGFITVD
jgi:hypothetical protein